MTLFRRGRLPRSALFVGVNLAMAAFVLLFLVVPVVGAFVERGERIADSSEQLARIKALQRTVPLADTGRALLPGVDEGSSGAVLQSDLKAIAAAAGANVVAVRGLEPTRLAEASIVGATVEVTGSVYAIRDVVRRIEDHAPAFLIKSATIRGRSADQDSELSAELTVEGIMQKGAPERTAEAARDGYGERGR